MGHARRDAMAHAITRIIKDTLGRHCKMLITMRQLLCYKYSPDERVFRAPLYIDQTNPEQPTFHCLLWCSSPCEFAIYTPLPLQRKKILLLFLQSALATSGCYSLVRNTLLILTSIQMSESYTLETLPEDRDREFVCSTSSWTELHLKVLRVNLGAIEHTHLFQISPETYLDGEIREFMQSIGKAMDAIDRPSALSIGQLRRQLRKCGFLELHPFYFYLGLIVTRSEKPTVPGLEDVQTGTDRLTVGMLSTLFSTIAGIWSLGLSESVDERKWELGFRFFPLPIPFSLILMQTLHSSIASCQKLYVLSLCW
jgi:hypothetical protein